jgi:hypothetical protein
VLCGELRHELFAADGKVLYSLGSLSQIA